MNYVIYRMGVLVVIRFVIKSGVIIGVMIIVFYNLEEDNGVKLVDLMGEMLGLEWEKYVIEVVNVFGSKLDVIFKELIKNLGVISL